MTKNVYEDVIVTSTLLGTYLPGKVDLPTGTESRHMEPNESICGFKWVSDDIADGLLHCPLCFCTTGNSLLWYIDF